MLPLRGRRDPGAMATNAYAAFLKVPALLEPHPQIVSVISRTVVGEVTLLQRYSRCILQTQLAGQALALDYQWRLVCHQIKKPNESKPNGVFFLLLILGLFSLFNGISAFVAYIIPKPSLEKNSNGYTRCLQYVSSLFFFIQAFKIVVDNMESGKCLGYSYYIMIILIIKYTLDIYI